jgi:hypothetical protein
MYILRYTCHLDTHAISCLAQQVGTLSLTGPLIIRQSSPQQVQILLPTSCSHASHPPGAGQLVSKNEFYTRTSTTISSAAAVACIRALCLSKRLPCE